MGAFELILILVVVMIVFGAGKLPNVMRDLGAGVKAFREGMASDDDGLRPARDEARHVFADDGFAEHGAVEDVADRAVGRFPHFLEVEFFHAGFVGRDGGALDADAVFLDGFRGFDRDFVVRRVAVFDSKIVVFQIHVEIRQD